MFFLFSQNFLLQFTKNSCIISGHYTWERIGDPVAQAGSGRGEAPRGNNKIKEDY